MKLIILIILIITQLSFSIHLNIYQKNLINNILKNNQLSHSQKLYIQHTLYNSYEKFAIKKAKDFKKFHYNKCKNSDLEEIILCAKYGLWKSIINFKGYTSLEKYSQIYIKSELNKYLTDKYSTSLISKKDRMKSKNNFTLSEKNNYNHLLQTGIFSYNWKFDKTNLNVQTKDNNNESNNPNLHNDYYKNIWFIINNTNLIDYNSKRILNLKFDFYFNKLRSNKEISHIMDYSEEYIRIKYIDTLTILKKIFTTIK